MTWYCLLQVLVSGWILWQFFNNIYVLATGVRDGQCSEALQIDFLESSTNALRSNNDVSGLFGALTSLIPFIIVYFVPVYEMFRVKFSQRIEGITADGIVFWFIAVLNVIAKYSWQEERPPAYRKCIQDEVSYGQPSGHAMWAVGLWTTCLVLFLTFPSQKNDREDPNPDTFRSWLYDSLAISDYLAPTKESPRRFWSVLLSVLWLFNIPFVRYDLQYNTLLQILSGMGLGVAGGLVGGIVLGTFPKVSQAVWLRTAGSVLWVCVNYAYSGKVDWTPLVVEVPLLLYQFYRLPAPTTVKTVKTVEDSNWSKTDEEVWQSASEELGKATIFF